MEEKIMTLHPAGKKGVNILKRRYDQVAETLLGIVKSQGEITYAKMNDLAEDQLEGKFDGKVPWYVVTVKLDLEARGILERIPKTSPHKLRLSIKGK